MELNKAISKRIKEILKEKNLTQYKLEQISGLPHNTLLCIMNCRYKSCNIKTLFIIFKALDISAEVFFDSDLFEINNINFLY